METTKNEQPTKKITIRENGTRRIQIFNRLPSKTEQSHKNSCDINLIMESYQRTGMLPQMKEKYPIFADVSQMPDLLQAHEMINQAQSAFLELPAKIRQLMDNDSRKLEAFITNPANQKICEKYGLIEIVRPPKTKPKVEPKVEPQNAPKPKPKAED